MKLEPQFPFGHGLSYTQFSYDKNPSIEEQHDEKRVVSLKIKNTGKMEGKEVVQLYLGFPQDGFEPIKQLKGFEKIALKPNEEKTAQFHLSDRDVSIWDVEQHHWKVQEG